MPLPEELHALDGPVFGEDAIDELDGDLTRQHAGEPLGERIVVSGRVLDEDGRPIRGALVEIWQANAARPLPPRGRPASGSARSELLRRRQGAHRRGGQLPLRDDQAGLVSLGQPRERVATGAHPLLGVRPGVHPATRHADVLPRGSAVRLRPDLPLGPRPEGARAADLEVRPRDDDARLGARLPLGHRARPRGRARPPWRSTPRDEDPVADGRPVLRDRAVPTRRERARPAGRPVGGRPARRAPRRRRGRRSRTG